MHTKTVTGKSILLKNALVSILIIVFFSAIIIGYYRMLIAEKQDSIIRDGEISAKKAETEIDQYLATSIDAIRLTAYMTESMIDEHKSNEEILEYLSGQSIAVMNAVFINTTGIYALIDGEYLDGAGWIPDEDYVPTERPWYYKTIENNGEITTIEPYVDMQTGSVVMTLAKMLKDGKSVVALDVFLDRIQEIVEESDPSGETRQQIILDDQNMIIAHTDRSEVGNVFGAEPGTLDAACLEQLNLADRDHYEFKYQGSQYIVYQVKMLNGLRCLSIEDASVMFRPLRVLLAVTFVVMLLIVSILGVILYQSGKRAVVAEQLNSQLSSAVEIYHSVQDLNIPAGTFTNIRINDDRITGVLSSNHANAQDGLFDVLNHFVEPMSREEVLRFADLSTLNERLRDRRSIAKEFLSTENHWFRGRFIVSERTPDGRILHVLWLVEDIDTEKRQRDQLLETVTKMNEQMSSVANIYFSMYDIDLANDMLQELRTSVGEESGSDSDHIEHAQTVMYAMMDETSHEQSRNAIHSFIDLSTLSERMKNTNTITEEFLNSKDVWCRTRFVISKRDMDGTIGHVLWLVEGIDEEKRRRDSLIDMSERAIAASEAKSSFLSNMSHEIRTPINAVLGMNEMILRESDDENVLSYSESIRTAGNTLLGIVNDILDFSKIEAGKMEIIPIDYDLSSVLNDLVNMVQTRADDKGLLLKLEFDPNTPKRLHGDEVRIKQVITNILTNAVKYTEKGSVTFAVSFERTSDEDVIFLNVSVRDTGIGIKEEDMAKLFSEFERIEEKRNRNIEGTGLGMNITQRLLGMMGSALKVESVYGEGSVFSFRLEQHVTAWEELGDYEESYRASLSKRSVSKARLSAPNAIVLVVDDTPMNLMVFKSLLKRTKVRIDTAASGDEGLALSYDKKYDMIFLDHMMPQKDGIETLHELRSREKDPNINTPTICLTANAISGAREKYLAEGFDDYLTKPIDSIKLEEMLLNYLPAEKIEEAADEEPVADTAAAKPEIPDVLQPLSGQDWIDISLGIKNSGDTETYLPLLKIFYESLDDKAEEIEHFYAEENWSDYTIKVHALKSSARIIGATGFGEEAQQLENAGKSGDIAYIRANHRDFMTKLQSFKAPLEEIFLKQEEENKPEADADLLAVCFDEIHSAAEDCDYDRLESIFNELTAYRIPAEHEERFRKILDAAKRFDYDAIKALFP